MKKRRYVLREEVEVSGFVSGSVFRVQIRDGLFCSAVDALEFQTELVAELARLGVAPENADEWVRNHTEVVSIDV